MDTSQPSELPSVPCPFCSSEQVIASQQLLENGMSGPFAIECSRCGAAGPKSDALAGAIRGWNSRKVLQRKRGGD